MIGAPSTKVQNCASLDLLAGNDADGSWSIAGQPVSGRGSHDYGFELAGFRQCHGAPTAGQGHGDGKGAIELTRR